MTTATDITTAVTDGTKLLEALPAIQEAYNNVQSTLTADEHKAVLTQVTDLVSAVTPSVTAAANAGLIGQADASHVQTIADAVNTGAQQIGFWTAIVNVVRSWF
jgi:hypothetical protein